MPDTAALSEFDPEAILDGKFNRRELILVIQPERIRHVCEFLKTQRGYLYLSDVTAVDWFPSEPLFEVIYHHSMRTIAKNAAPEVPAEQ